MDEADDESLKKAGLSHTSFGPALKQESAAAHGVMGSGRRVGGAPLEGEEGPCCKGSSAQTPLANRPR